MTYMNKIDLAILRTGNVSNIYKKRYGIVEYIDEFITNMPISSNTVLLEFVYPVSRLRSSGTTIIVDKTSNSDSAEFLNQLILKIDDEYLNILLANIALKFDNVHVEHTSDKY